MFFADFHVHSKYSLATSRDCAPETLAFWARRKGLAVVGTGDCTHPGWRAELREKLEPAGDGLYALKSEYSLIEYVANAAPEPRFIVSGEISSIYKQGGRTRRVHNLVILPTLEAAEALSRKIEALGGNVRSDGRPILGISSRDLLEITLDACAEAIFIPAHIWTPHFSVLGAKSGFDSIEECFGDLAGYIFALETGLSADPPMIRRVSALDRFALVSNSDAHSPANLAREANMFDCEVSFCGISSALRNRGKRELIGTIEFFPEEGKYHYDGHRACGVCISPREARETAGVCPKCGGRLTQGVLNRVEELADRDDAPEGVIMCERLVPLREVIAAALGAGPASAKVRNCYDGLIREVGPELFVLREAAEEDIAREAGSVVAQAVGRVRRGEIAVSPGYDGVYGKIGIMGD